MDISSNNHNNEICIMIEYKRHIHALSSDIDILPWCNQRNVNVTMLDSTMTVNTMNRTCSISGPKQDHTITAYTCDSKSIFYVIEATMDAV